jgi:hypothetical protein
VPAAQDWPANTLKRLPTGQNKDPTLFYFRVLQIGPPMTTSPQLIHVINPQRLRTQRYLGSEARYRLGPMAQTERVASWNRWGPGNLIPSVPNLLRQELRTPEGPSSYGVPPSGGSGSAV